MNDELEPDLEVTPTDELASALLDDEAAPDERARSTEPDVAARLETFAGLARLVGTPVPPPSDAERDAGIAAALAAFDAGAGADAGDATAAPVVDELAVRRARARRTWRIASVAAAVAAVLGVGALVAAQDGGGEDVAGPAAEATADASGRDGAGDATAGAAPEVDEQQGGDAAGGAGGGDDGAGPLADNGAAFVVDLGTFDDVDDLTQALRSRAAAPMATASPAPGGQPPADSETSGFVACLSQEPGDVVEQYRATLAGRPIFIVVLQAPDTLAREAVAYDAATCDVVVDVTQ